MTKKQADEIDRILRDGGYISPKHKDKSDCQYHGKDDRYCMATTQDKCNKCRFYEPTTFAKNRMLMEEIIRHEKEEKRKDKLIHESHLQLVMLTEEMGKKEDTMYRMIAEYERDLRRAEFIREFIRRWWHER